MKISRGQSGIDRTAPGVGARIDSRPACTDRERTGVSLVELLVSVTIMGILMAMAVPSFRRAVDQSRADIAAANLRAIWSAERCYWLDNRSYTDDLSQLAGLGLLDPSIVNGNPYYAYTIPVADNNAFTAVVTRASGSKWSGQFVIDQTGIVSGSIEAAGENSIVPGFQ